MAGLVYLPVTMTTRPVRSGTISQVNLVFGGNKACSTPYMVLSEAIPDVVTGCSFEGWNRGSGEKCAGYLAIFTRRFYI